MFLDNPISNPTSTICHPWALIALSSSFIGPRKLSIPTAAVWFPCVGWFCRSASLAILGSFLSPNRISQRAQRGEFSKPPYTMPTNSQTPCGHRHREGGKQSRCQAQHTSSQINMGICNHSSRQKNPSRKYISFESQIITHANKL